MEIELFVNWLCVEAQHRNKIEIISNVFATILDTVVGFLYTFGYKFPINKNIIHITEQFYSLVVVANCFCGYLISFSSIILNNKEF
jgi:hypothetical protein